MNAPYQSQTLLIPLPRIKIVQTYRYLFQYKALRIVTEDCDEYIFDFTKQKYCQRAIEALLGKDDQPTLCLNASDSVSIGRLDYF